MSKGLCLFKYTLFVACLSRFGDTTTSWPVCSEPTGVLCQKIMYVIIHINIELYCCNVYNILGKF